MNKLNCLNIRCHYYLASREIEEKDYVSFKSYAFKLRWYNLSDNLVSSIILASCITPKNTWTNFTGVGTINAYVRPILTLPSDMLLEIISK